MKHILKALNRRIGELEESCKWNRDKYNKEYNLRLELSRKVSKLEEEKQLLMDEIKRLKDEQ